MGKTSRRRLQRHRRKKHTQKTIRGTAERPRLCVFRSSKHIYGQIIDDKAGKTLVSASSLNGDLELDHGGNREAAEAVGSLLAKRALDQDIKAVVFDRNGYLYHGRVAALADAAREAGLEF